VQISSSGALTGVVVTFRATIDNAQSYNWDFGDGGTGTGQVVAHSYANEGQYTVTLEITTTNDVLTFSKLVDIIADVGVGPPPAPAHTGEIGDVISSSLEFEQDTMLDPDIIQVGNGVYAVAYRGVEADGFVTTFSIDASGNIANPEIETFEFQDILNASNPDIIEVGPGIYAIAYGRGLSEGYVATLGIDSSGNIGSVIEGWQYAVSGGVPQILEVGTEIYAIAHSGAGNDGFVTTIQIEPNGNIVNSVIETVEFLDSDAFTRDFIEVGSDIYAITYEDSNFDGHVTTVSIDSSGDIGDPFVDTFEFAPIQGFFPNIIQVGSGVYALVYQGPDNDGFVTTVGINSSGAINKTVIDNFEFEASDLGNLPDIIEVGSGVYAIVYEGPSDDGFVTTVSIDSLGNITPPALDSFEFDPSHGQTPVIIEVGNGIFAIAYEGLDEDGFVVTVTID
jgi:PKD repeat protein